MVFNQVPFIKEEFVLFIILHMYGLQVGDTVGVSRHSDTTMHIFINSKDLGPVCTDVPEVSNVLYQDLQICREGSDCN